MLPLSSLTRFRRPWLRRRHFDLRWYLQHLRSRDPHPDEVDQANSEHDQRVKPWRGKRRCITEDGKLKKQPDNRENDDRPLKNPQTEALCPRQFSARPDVENDCGKVDDRWQQGCGTE